MELLGDLTAGLKEVDEWLPGGTGVQPVGVYVGGWVGWVGRDVCR